LRPITPLVIWLVGFPLKVELLITPSDTRKHKRQIRKQGQDARIFNEGEDFTRTYLAVLKVIPSLLVPRK
jgi:hypothetical protein